jgi:hypothetical protein
MHMDMYYLMQNKFWNDDENNNLQKKNWNH